LSIAVGLVGYGLSARILQRPLIEAAGMNIVAAVTHQHEALRQNLPGAVALPDVASLLALPRLDLVVIATPNQLHFPQALAALEDGKHVVIDKPMALDVRQCDRLIEVADARGRALTVFHNRRWDSDFLTLQQLIASDALGPIVTFEARWDRYRPTVPDRWRERADHGGGVLYDLGAHLIDQALCLFGQPEWIEADVFRQRAGASVDDAFQIRMGQGTRRIVLESSSIAADASLRYTVHGAQASFRKSGLDVQEQQLRDGLPVADPAFGVEPPAQWGTLIPGTTAGNTIANADANAKAVQPERGVWCEFYRILRRHIESDAAASSTSATVPVPVPVPADEARAVIQIIEAARASSATGRRLQL
jgi:scyllo-inositol 2-dehydrogenase (NADP+)